MASKKTPPVEEEEVPIVPEDEEDDKKKKEEEKEDDYSYKDIKDQTPEDIAAGKSSPEDESEKKEKEEEAAKQKEIDEELAKEKEDIAKSVRDDLRKEQEEAEKERVKAEEERVAAEERQKAMSPDEKAYVDFEKATQEKEGRTPTYQEAMDFMSDMAEKRVLAKQEQARIDQEKVQEEEKQKAQKTDEDINKVIDDELQDLYKGGLLTPIEDKANPSDPGVIERKELFRQWMEVNADRRAKGLPEITSVTRIRQFYFKKPNTEVPGGDAPVAGNKSSATITGKEKEYSYADLKKPWSRF